MNSKNILKNLQNKTKQINRNAPENLPSMLSNVFFIFFSVLSLNVFS